MLMTGVKMALPVAALADRPENALADWLFEKFTNDDGESISEL